jgi:hypothetical protein
MREPERQEALEGLYKALKEASIPGVRLELDSGPVVYAHNTCTRVRGDVFFIRKILPNGTVLETASLGTRHRDIAVSVIRVMSFAHNFT